MAKIKIIFENAQWRVTDWGLESVGRPTAPVYLIDAARLLGMNFVGKGNCYFWPFHMAAKNWVDIEAFIEAFQIAIGVHKGNYKGNVNPTFLALSLAKAREEVRRRHAKRS